MNTYKIAFFIELNKIKNKLNNVNIDLGNPGIGGTQYTFLLTVKYLNRTYGKGFAVLLTDTEINFHDDEISTYSISSCKEAINFCEKNNISRLVFNANSMSQIPEGEFETNIKLFFWAHNTLNWKNQCLANRKKSIKKIICVSKKQYENMKDTPCFKKCTFINNVITSYFYDNAKISNYSGQKVVYVGSAMPQKGMHNLLNIWKYVEKENKTAQLYIFGGASIWNNNIKLGKLGVSDLYYEKIIQKKYNRLKHQENVHFMGAIGWKEICEYLIDANVGIVNPSYYKRDETFCISAIELQAHGLPVVSRQRSDGLNSTIINNKTGYLEKNDKQIAEKILLLLQDNSLIKKMGVQAREYSKEFIIQNEINKWKELIDIDENEENVKYKFYIKSKDAKYLDHDLLLKIIFTIKSGKIFYLIRKKLNLVFPKRKDR